MITTIAKMSSDLKNAGAPEWAYNLGYVLGVLLVLGIVLWLGIRAIKKVVKTSNNNEKQRKKKGKK